MVIQSKTCSNVCVSAATLTWLPGAKEEWSLAGQKETKCTLCHRVLAIILCIPGVGIVAAIIRNLFCRSGTMSAASNPLKKERVSSGSSGSRSHRSSKPDEKSRKNQAKERHEQQLNILMDRFKKRSFPEYNPKLEIVYKEVFNCGLRDEVLREIMDGLKPETTAIDILVLNYLVQASIQIKQVTEKERVAWNETLKDFYESLGIGRDNNIDKGDFKRLTELLVIKLKETPESVIERIKDFVARNSNGLSRECNANLQVLGTLFGILKIDILDVTDSAFIGRVLGAFLKNSGLEKQEAR